ncbi:MAG: Membrane alanine aminopeptidase [Myxococcaceae bacterium]|nr:Membrane alanine aminopeptidase [Myxococcaceae bacterium]
MRFSATLLVSALLVSCAPKPAPRPPVQAPPRAPVETESPPRGRLPADVRPEAYRIELELDPDKPTYSGVVSVDVTLDQPRATIWLHSRGLRVAAVALTREGAPALSGKLEQAGESGLSAVRLPQPVGPGRVTLTLPFEADFGTHLTGLYKADSAGAHYAFTQFEPISAREAFPCFDEPRFKTPFALKLRVRKEHVAVANTRIASEREWERGLREVTFAPTEKLPTYLVAFAVGALDVAPAKALPASEVRTRELPLGGVAVHGRGADMAYALEETPPLLSWLERYFGVAYPYDKLDLLAVPDFGAGAMENAGAITFRDTLLLVRPDASEQQKRSLSYVNAHELSHQWFGNLVTMPWWDDIWLNEAFATWMGTRAVNAVHPEYEAALGALSATQGAMEIDSRTSARKIRQPIESDHDIENAFDAITYSKGGAVLSMFERFLGAEKFQAGLRLYMERFRFGNATARDLVQTLAEVSGEKQLESAFFSFLEQPGVPQLQVKLDCTSSPPALDIEQSRYLPLGTSVQGAFTWQIPFCARMSQAGVVNEQCVLLSEQKTRVPLAHASCPLWIMPNAGASGYYRWALSEKTLESLVAHRKQLPVPEQMSLASNVSAALKAGRLEPERAIATQKLLLASEHRHVMESALKTFWLVRELLDDASLPAFRSEVAKLLRPSYQKLGLLPRTKGPIGGEEKLRRSSLVRAMFNLAEDPKLTFELASLGAPLLSATGQTAGKPSLLPSELLEVALAAAVRAGGAPSFELAEAQLLAASDGLQRSRLLNAMSSVRDAALGARVLALALDARLRTNERLLPLFGQMSQPETREHAFAWLRENFDALSGQLGAHGGNDVIAATASFCSEDKAREVEAFFGPKSPQIPGGPRELLLTLESIRSCAALASTYGDKVRALYQPGAAAK